MNYDLLFRKCLPYNIDLNWLIYGKLMPHAVKENPELLLQAAGSDKDDAMENLHEEEKVVTIVEMIRQFPWPLSTRRIIMENYINLVYSEVKESKGQQRER